MYYRGNPIILILNRDLLTRLSQRVWISQGCFEAQSFRWPLFLTVTKLRSRSCACQEQQIPWKERNNEEIMEKLSLTCDGRFEKKS